MKRLLFILTVALLINPASAWYNPFNPANQRKADSFESVYAEISTYNTPQNINLISGYMRDYNVNIIKVHVVELNRDFYVLKGAGTTLQVQTPADKTIKLTRAQIWRIESFIADGQLSWFEQWQLWAMYKSG